MSPEPSESIAAFVSKVPFFRGLGSGVKNRLNSKIMLKYNSVGVRLNKLLTFFIVDMFCEAYVSVFNILILFPPLKIWL